MKNREWKMGGVKEVITYTGNFDQEIGQLE